MDILIDRYIMRLYQDMEDEVISDIARRVKKTGRYTETAELMAKAMREQGYSPSRIQAEVMKHLRADKAYQKAVAENTRAYKQEIQDIIDQLVKDAKKAGDQLVAEAGNMAWNNDLSMWKEHGEDLTRPNTMGQLMNAFKRQTSNELKNLTRSMGFKSTVFGTTGVMTAYQRELDLALIKVASGTFSFDQAVNDCVHRLAQSGLRSIDYANGRSYQLDTAARMSVRTGLSQLAGKIMEENLKNSGQDLVITSQHMGSRPEHAVWQNKVFSFSGKNKKYPDFVKSTGYGTVEGLKGANCCHDFYPFWEGASVIPEDMKEPEPVTINGKEYTYYQATQKQRQMERNIRATKREIEAQKTIGGDTTILQAQLRKQSADYKKFSESAGLKVRSNRLRNGKTRMFYQKTLNSSAYSINTGTKVFYNDKKQYLIYVEGYGKDINEKMSLASREVAKLGSENGFEYGVFVNLETGEIDKIVTDEIFNSVRPNYRYLIDNPKAKVAFIHNHGTDSELSFPDITLLANEIGINIVAGVRNDGIIYVVESNGRKTTKYLELEYLEQKYSYIRENNLDISKQEDAFLVETYLRDIIMKEYCKGGMKVYGEQ